MKAAEMYLLPSIERPDLLVSYVQKGIEGCQDVLDVKDYYEGWLRIKKYVFRINLSILGKHVRELSYFVGISLKIENKAVNVPDNVFVNPLVFSNIGEIIKTAKKMMAEEKEKVLKKRIKAI